MRTCTKCGEPKPLSEFYQLRKGLHPSCKECHKAGVRAEYARNRAGHIRRGQARRYGVSLEWYDATLLAQGGLCAICARPPDARAFCVDHDHVTGSVRGVLCPECNLGMGKFGDDADRLRAAVRYLDSYRAQDGGS